MGDNGENQPKHENPRQNLPTKDQTKDPANKLQSQTSDSKEDAYGGYNQTDKR